MSVPVRDAIRGFYAVLDRDDEALARQLLSAGARVLQLRLKGPRACSTRALVALARRARRWCDEAGAALVINDRVDVALLANADGVHLGQTDLPLRAARRIAGSLWIGVSTHTLQQVQIAVSEGADYLGFGPVFETRTKANPDPVQGITGLRAAVAVAAGTPIVAIGGCTPDHATALYDAGAAAVCAISAINDSADVVANARRLHRNPAP